MSWIENQYGDVKRTKYEKDEKTGKWKKRDTTIDKDSPLRPEHWEGWKNMDKSWGAKTRLQTDNRGMRSYATVSPTGDEKVTYQRINDYQKKKK